MRTDLLTALLLDPFLAFGEAAKECGERPLTDNAARAKPGARRERHRRPHLRAIAPRRPVPQPQDRRS